MNSIKIARKEYETLSTGILEWDIEEGSLCFEECDYVNEGQTRVVVMNSETVQLRVVEGKQSNWHFSLRSWPTSSNRNVQITLHFDGLVASNGIPIDKPLHFKYNFVLDKRIGETFQVVQTLKGRERSKTWWENVYMPAIVELKKLLSNEHLKITVQISHLSDKVEQVFKSNQFLDLLNFNPVSVSSCYGNLMDNPDLSDFKIMCVGSTFRFR